MFSKHPNLAYKCMMRVLLYRVADGWNRQTSACLEHHFSYEHYKTQASCWFAKAAGPFVFSSRPLVRLFRHLRWTNFTYFTLWTYAY